MYVKSVMGTYFSKSDTLSEISESIETVDKTCNEDMIATSRFMNNHTPMSVSRKYEYCNNGKPTDEKIAKKVEEKYAFTNKSYILPNCKVRIEFLKHPASTELNNNSNEKPRTQSGDYLNKVVDVTKLIAQLMSSKVVLTKLKEPSTFKFPATRAISVHKNIDLDDDKEQEDVASETLSDEYAHRYCANCKKIKFARVKDPAWKKCSDCKIEMTYLCVKCNSKQYKRYPFLNLHLERCDGNGDGLAKPSIDQDVDNESNADKDFDTDKLHLERCEGNGDGLAKPTVDQGSDDESNSGDEKELIVDKNLFIVKQMTYAKTTKKYCRYCPQCKMTFECNSAKLTKCSKCNGTEDSLFMCTKCKKKYTVYSSLKSHLSNHCYWTNQYKCTQCDEYSTTGWKDMLSHFTYHHTDRLSFKCKLCPHKTRTSYHLNRHTRLVHSKFEKQFKCNDCSYSTNFRKNLRRHKQLKH